MNRKEREREFKRNEIIEAAVSIFASKGYEHTTLDEIAEAAEFGKGTIYNYFKNKEELYMGILEESMSDFYYAVKEIDESTTTFFEFITRLTKEMLIYLKENSSKFIMIMHMRFSLTKQKKFELSQIFIQHQKAIESIAANKIKSAMKKGEIGEDDNPARIFNLYRGLVFSHIHNLHNCGLNLDFDVEKEAEFVNNFLLNGLRKP
ncbi:MAG: TetR/AcrR family transcriptional regulator [Bacteroidetes bacterium]|nr:TetR/AcrR family transcriptional regulator [Bacteroidota bacterium]MBU1680394.1 TetR/AcrR family transcriptional regulator [Bacteroidota bacterium]MBU2507193.1 TetR/AcrR family transcriptional regulator [Bacteroidota bacterium]